LTLTKILNLLEGKNGCASIILNIMYTCVKMEKGEQLKLFQEWGGGKRE
jgi:hypothetical protein